MTSAWVVGLWGSAKSMARVAKYDGILPAKRQPDGSFGEVDQETVREIAAWARTERTSSTPFDIVMEGKTAGLSPRPPPTGCGRWPRRARPGGWKACGRPRTAAPVRAPGSPNASRRAHRASDNGRMTTRQPRLEIEYCTQCRWLLRAAWTAQELLTTFTTDLGEVALVPGTGGVFDVRLDGQPLWSRGERGFPDLAELKRLVRDQVAPDRDLGHTDRR